MAKHETSGGTHARHAAESERTEPKRRARTEAEERPVRHRTEADKPRKKAAPERDYFEEEAPRPAPKKSRGKKKRRLKKRLTTAAIVLGSLLLALICGALYAGSCVSASETNLPNVFLDGIDVSGLTKEETVARLQEQGWDPCHPPRRRRRSMPTATAATGWAICTAMWRRG